MKCDILDYNMIGVHYASIIMASVRYGHNDYYDKLGIA